MQAVQTVQNTCFPLLPQELAYHVFQWFTPKELALISRVAQVWRETANKDCFWNLHYRHDFGSWIPKEISNLNWKMLYIAQTHLWRQNPMRWNLAKDAIGALYGNEIWALCQRNGKLLIVQRDNQKVLQVLETGITNATVTLMRLCGNYLVIGFKSGQVQVWNWKTGDQGDPHIGRTNERSMDPQGKYLVLMDQDDSSIRVIDMPGGQLRRTLQHPRCNQVQIHGDIVVSLSSDTLRIWKILESYFCNEIQPWVGFGPIHNFLLHDHLIFIGSIAGFITVWNCWTREFVHVLVGHKDLIKVMEVYGEFLLTISEDDILKLWDYKKGECIFSLPPNPSSFEEYNSVHIERHLLACGTTLGRITIWNIKTQKCLWDLCLPNHCIHSVTLQDGTLIAKVSGLGVVRWNFLNALPKNLEFKSANKDRVCAVM